ncbi:MAG: pirin family protein [Bacteroidetes bacterium]|nr:MAG: pirin family protein [Bacteroidota bacterium]
MKTIIHRAESRGHANHGWLDTHHTFSFASYMNPERMHFGALRVLNDDIIQGGTGFGTHPHENMEIVSIPLSGGLEHKDSTGRHKVIVTGDVQIMSAGSGIYHSEYNHHKDQKTNFLQIWVFPKTANIAPRYDQKLYEAKDRKNKWQTVVSPKEGEALYINQDAWFSLADLEKEKSLSYTRNKAESILYLFVIDGEVSLGTETLKRRDGMGISDADIKDLKATADAQLLLMEVPKLQ